MRIIKGPDSTVWYTKKIDKVFFFFLKPFKPKSKTSDITLLCIKHKNISNGRCYDGQIFRYMMACFIFHSQHQVDANTEEIVKLTNYIQFKQWSMGKVSMGHFGK